MSHPRTDDEFLEKINKANTSASIAIFGQPGFKSTMGWFYLLPYKHDILTASNPQILYEIWDNAYFVKTNLRMGITFSKHPEFWKKVYSEMFNHVAPISALDIKEDDIYKLKSSSRTLKVVDGDENTVVIQFMDNKTKMDLPRKDFDTECELVK